MSSWLPIVNQYNETLFFVSILLWIVIEIDLFFLSFYLFDVASRRSFCIQTSSSWNRQERVRHTEKKRKKKRNLQNEKNHMNMCECSVKIKNCKLRFAFFYILFFFCPTKCYHTPSNFEQNHHNKTSTLFFLNKSIGTIVNLTLFSWKHLSGYSLKFVEIPGLTFVKLIKTNFPSIFSCISILPDLTCWYLSWK